MGCFGQSSEFAVLMMKEDVLGTQSRRSGKARVLDDTVELPKNTGQLTFDFILQSLAI